MVALKLPKIQLNFLRPYPVSPIKNEHGSIIAAVLVFSKPSEPNRGVIARDKDVEEIISKTSRQIIPITIVVASPSHLVQEGIRKIVEPQRDITIVAEASSLLDILVLIRQKRPDILCIDTSLPDLDILKIQRSINEDNIDTKILLLLHRLDDEFIIKSLYLGVDGYLKNTSTPDILLRAIRAINNDEIWAERDILTKMLRRFMGSRNNNLALLMSKLTGREKEIFRLLTQGCSNKQIAQELSISRNTVRNHISNIFDKVGINNRLHVEFDLICDDLK
jgi:DNA-binding NarL/FixJ family response regulator